MTHGELWTALACTYVGKYGLSVIPIGQDKKPLVKWTDYQSRHPSVKELLAWQKENLAIVTGSISNLVIVDCESKEDAIWFAKYRSKSPSMVQTKRGYHFYFRHPGGRVQNAQKVKDEQGTPRYDVRGDGGYALAPPSVNRKWIKPLIMPSELPVFDMAWRPETRIYEASEGQIRDAVKYISKIQAIAGQDGHGNTYRAACVLADSGLSEGEALVALQEWNRTNADPPWSDRDLLHKVKSAFAGK
jgi:hypothetical protein